MKSYSRRHLADSALLRSFEDHDSSDRLNLAELLGDLAEMESRRIHVPLGYSSLFEYCLRARNWSEDMAGKRIRVARAGRRFPAMLGAIADGRLHLTGAFLIARHLTRENFEELIAEAAGKSRAQIERLLARRFPKPDLLFVLKAIEVVTGDEPVLPVLGQVTLAGAAKGTGTAAGTEDQERVSPVLGQVRLAGESDPAPVPTPQAENVPASRLPARLTPRSEKLWALQVMFSDHMHGKLERFADMAGSKVAPNDVAALLEYALDLAIATLDKRKFGATGRPRAGRKPKNPRTIPAAVRRAVRKRDEGRCTFTSDAGHRCACRRVEYDHVIPVARGGAATVDNLRLRCRAHNQYAAEQAFGAAFMERKRQTARSSSERVPASQTAPITPPEAAGQHALALEAARVARRELAKLWAAPAP